MSAIRFVRRLVENGFSYEKALIAAEVFEEISSASSRVDLSQDQVWVYVMSVDQPGDNLVKVGVSKHPSYRLSKLEKERGFNLLLAHTEGPFSRSVAMSIESKAHSVLSDERERGEWFLCGASRAIDVVRYCVTGEA